MGYRYSKQIAKSILKILDEDQIDSKSKSIKKIKGSKPSLLSSDKNRYVIREKVYNRFQTFDPPYSPSRMQYKVTFYELKDLKIIEENPDKKNQWKTTDLGHICNIYDHDPKDYKTFYLIWSYICFRASTGILLGVDGTNSSSSTKPIVFTEPEPGIAPIDILEHKSRINLPHVNTNNIEISPDELREHFDLLVEHKILKKIGEAGKERFDLNHKYKKFILTSNTIFLKLLKERMEFRWEHVHRPESKEREWYQTIFGNQVTKEKTSDLARRLRNNKEKNLEQRKKWEKELINYDKGIIDDYNNLLKENNELDNIQGFVETILSILCPKVLIELIQSEYNELKSKN